ncbi:MAG TPA: hypothetical protein VLF20_04475 [Patescibacteria group bacterium]|nr:hypothetical protein [Patescibacteria group bacterium]
MANRFEASWFRGITKRHIIRRVDPWQETQQFGTITTEYSRGFPGSKLVIVRSKDQRAPKVRTDKKGGYVVRPSRWARTDEKSVSIYASGKIDVWVSSKVSIHDPKASSRAQLSVRTFHNEGLANSAATLHVRGSAPRIEVKDRATAIVDWHTDRAFLYNPSTFTTRTADFVGSSYYGESDQKTKITVRRGRVTKLKVTGNVDATVNNMKTILAEGAGNQITTNSYENLYHYDEGQNILVIKTPRGRQLYPQQS